MISSRNLQGCSEDVCLQGAHELDEAAARGPTSFAGLRGMAASAAELAPRIQSKRKAVGPALLGMLSGSRMPTAAVVGAGADSVSSARAAANLSRLLGATSGVKRQKAAGSYAAHALFKKAVPP